MLVFDAVGILATLLSKLFVKQGAHIREFLVKPVSLLLQLLLECLAQSSKVLALAVDRVVLLGILCGHLLFETVGNQRELLVQSEGMLSPSISESAVR